MQPAKKQPAKITHLPRPEDRLERALAPFFRDLALWPVTLVVLAHVVLAIATLLLEALRDPGPFGIAALALLVVASADVLRRDLVQRRLGPLGGAVIACWIVGAIGAYGAARLGLY